MSTVVRVKFDENGRADNRTYVYGCIYTNVAVGDRVIVDSPYHGYTTVTVIEVGVTGLQQAPKKEVVCMIDDREYKQRLACKARLDEIEKALDTKREEIRRNLPDELLRADPTGRSLLAEKQLLESGRAILITNEDMAEYTGMSMEDLFGVGNTKP